MDWKTWYQEHRCTPQEAVQKIRSGSRVVVAHACGEPAAILDAMVANAAQYENVEIIHMVAMGKAAYCQPQYDKNFHHNAFFLGGSTRAAAAEGRADFTPVYFSEIPSLLREELRPDVTLLQCSPPDEHGYVSLGVSVDYTKGAAESAGLVIAQVNRNMPRTLGDSFLHVTQIDCLVPLDAPVIELAPPKITQVERAIGENVAQLIRDGDTPQFGIGAIPDAVLLFLKEKNDLGIHTEMFSDGVVALAEAGVVTNRAKTLHRGQSVATFLMGTRRLYDYVDNNPAVAMYPVDYVNDPYVIGQNDNLVSINSCVQIDIMGQVVSSSAGLRQISGVGGQVDICPGRQPVQRRPRHHGHALHHRQGDHLQDRSLPGPRLCGDDLPERCKLCGHRVWRRTAAGQIPAAARRSPDPNCPPGLPGRAAGGIPPPLSPGLLNLPGSKKQR